MRLLFVIDCLGSGGAQRQMVTLACAMVERGHSVEIFTYYDLPHFSKMATEGGIGLRHYQKRFRFSVGPVLALRKLMKDGRYDCVLAFLRTPSLYAELAKASARVSSPLVVSERFSYSADSLGLLGRIRENAHRLASWITVNSFSQGNVMVGAFPWMSRKI